MKMRPEVINYGSLLLLGLTWGSSFILIKKGLEGFSSMQVASLRICIGFLALTPLIPRFIRKVRRRDVKFIVLVALFGNGIPAFLFAFAETHIESSMTGIMNSLTPLFTFMLGIALFGVIFSFRKLAGVITGLAGAIFLLTYGIPQPDAETFLFGSFIILATICYATSVNIVKTYLPDLNAISITCVSFSLMFLPVSIYLVASGAPHKIMTDPVALSSLGFIAILGVVGTAMANMVYFNLTQRTSALFASTVTYIIPLVAVMWGFTAGEKIGWVHVAGMTMILAGVYLSRNRKKKPNTNHSRITKCADC